MATDFDKAFAFTVSPAVEGGLADIKGDTGGRTIFGISERWFPEIERKIEDMIKAGQNVAAMVAVKQFYHDEFWVKNSCDKLPYAVNCFMFDSSVNAGAYSTIDEIHKAIKIAINIYHNKDISVDHVLSDADYTYIHNIVESGDDDLFTFLCCVARTDHYLDIANANENDRAVLRGWLNRSKNFRKAFLSPIFW